MGAGGHLADLEKRLKAVQDAHAALAPGDDWSELWRIIHMPGWTTPPEWLFATGILEYVEAQTRALTTLRTKVLQAARAVGQSGGD